MQREDVSFLSGADRCAAWLYRPSPRDAEPSVPCVVMAHGFSAVRDQRLDAYAERFADAGLAALVFDYRHFGDSEGEPRQLLDIRRQHEDWRAALAFVRTLAGIDRSRVAIWGSSFGGGHVMAIAAEDHEVACAVAQVPFVDGVATLRATGLRRSLPLVREGLRDELGGLLGRAPHTIAAAGAPGSVAVMRTPDAEPGMRAITPPGSRWRNEVAARIALRVGSYRPARAVARIRCPILFCVADNDVLTPPALALRAAAGAPRSEVRRYPIGHFEIYLGEPFERAVADQCEFLARHLLGPSRAPAPQAPATQST